MHDRQDVQNKIKTNMQEGVLRYRQANQPTNQPRMRNKEWCRLLVFSVGGTCFSGRGFVAFGTMTATRPSGST